MTPRLSHILLAAGLVLGLIGATVFALDAYHQRQVTQGEAQANEAKGEASAHANQAQDVPDHAKELEEAQASVDRARAEVARLRKLLAAKPVLPVPGPADSNPAHAEPVATDDRDETIAALDGLVSAQDKQIGTLKAALSDKTRQSEEWRLAFEAERRRAVGLEIALDAQKHVAATREWVGGFKGLVVGIVLGYAGGKR
jgi:hypothetical protein